MVAYAERPVVSTPERGRCDEPCDLRPEPSGGERRAVVPGRAAQPGKPTRSQRRRGARPARAPAVGEVVGRAAIDLGRIWETIHARAPEEFRISARRPDDLLVFDLVFENLQLAEGEPARLVRKDPRASAFFLVEFPPQSFGEQAFLENSGATNPDDTAVPEPIPGFPPVASIRMAGRSRVAFEMPPEADDLPYTLADVLEACRTWPMRLDVNAVPDPEFLLDRPWLRLATESSSWAAATASLIQGIGDRVDRPIAQAARRVGEVAATALARRQMRGLDKRIQAAMETELGRLAEKHPQLREGQGRDLGLAAIALGAARSLAGSRRKFEFDPSLLGRIPIFLIPFGPHEPSRSVTALELPYRLLLSPLAAARWRHSDESVERHGRTELWHTRLSTGGSGDTGPDLPSKVRAIWSPDYPIALDVHTPPMEPAAPFRMSLDPLDRQWLVRLMAGFNEQRHRRPYVPRASIANRVMLSALGGLVDVQGQWDRRPEGVDLQQWRHIAALGRDQYVRVVYAGFLCPFGHAASLVKVTERKFEPLSAGRAGERIAVLRQRFFIVVREHVKSYDGSNHEFSGHNFPFTSVEILTHVTPNLTEPGKGASALTGAGGKAVDGAFWPMVSATSDFRFDIAATDICGNRVTFSMPLLFVGATANESRAAAVRAGYDDAGTAARRRAVIGGTTICFAPLPDGDDPKGDPRLPTASLTFDAGRVRSESDLHANFYPEIETAEVAIRALQRLLGQLHAVVGVRYPDEYRKNGFGGANQGEVFLQTLTDYALDFGAGPGKPKSDALGGLATPSMAIQGLSRIMGPAGDLGAVQSNSFNPANFFKDAKILGGIPLASLLATVAGLAGDDVPKMLSRELPKDGALPQRVEARFSWETEIKQPDPLGLFIPRADQVGTTTLDMSGVVTTPIDDPAAASYEATARIDNFKVNLFGFITIWFDLLRFDAKRGQKPDVAVDLHPGEDSITFGGPLEFVNGLRHLIPAGGFSDPPGIAVTPSGITASYSLNLPAVQVGVFALTNASLGAGFALPFDAQPATVRFNFSEREHPFSLTVSLLGGGGFFALGIGSAGVKEIEAALEFGAAVSIDLGVASGGVEIKAGVYFHWLEPVPNKGSVELAGYVRLHGELSVLGIISASLTFNLQIAYLKDVGAGKSIVWGEATLVVEIEILFFSASVSVKCRREFAGSASDPGFAALVPSPTVWADYCGAFAEEAA